MEGEYFVLGRVFLFYCAVKRKFGNFEEKLKQQKQEWMRNDDAEKEGK